MQNINEQLYNELKALDTVPAKGQQHHLDTTMDMQGVDYPEDCTGWEVMDGFREAVEAVIPANCCLEAEYDHEANVLRFYLENNSVD